MATDGLSTSMWTWQRRWQVSDIEPISFEAGKMYEFTIRATTSGSRGDAQVVNAPTLLPDMMHGHEMTIDTTQPFTMTVELWNPDGTRMTDEDFKRAVRRFRQGIVASRRLRRERRSVTKR